MEELKRNSATLKLTLGVYEGAWRLALPLLKKNTRLKDGYSQRRLQVPLPAADLWIQAASGGEAYLASELIRNLYPDRPLRILVTTNTRQGMEILEKAAPETIADSGPTLFPRFFPFDRPAAMDQAVRQVDPKMVVLLETEIWPGLLHAAKSAGRPVCIVNGRMTEKSLSRYIRFQKFFYELRPDRVLAISGADARRFGMLFGPDRVGLMSNIKFDRVPTGNTAADEKFRRLIPREHPFLVFGSIREEEEPLAEKMIGRIRARCPDTVIGLFPRHMHRLKHWQNVLDRSGTPWCLRSELKPPAGPGRVLLWDTFGELSGAYAAAAAVFVGGSLAPLGGQNFLEPLMHGVVPVIGLSYENFAWIGEEIFDKHLVIRAANWEMAADCLIGQIRQPTPREKIRSAALDYIRKRQGGTRAACRLIRDALGLAPEPDFSEA